MENKFDSPSPGEMPEHIKKLEELKQNRRGLLKSVTGGVVAGWLGVRAGEKVAMKVEGGEFELGKMWDLKNMEVRLAMGNHVSTIAEVERWMNESEGNLCLAGEVNLYQVIEALRGDDGVGPARKQSVLEDMAGVGATNEERREQVRALGLVLEKGLGVVVADAMVGIDEELLDKMVMFDAGVGLAEVTAEVYLALGLVDEVRLRKKHGEYKSILAKEGVNRRRFIKGAVAAVAGPGLGVVGTKMSSNIEKGRGSSNDIAERMQNATMSVIEELREKYDDEVALFAELVVHGRSLKILRNTEIMAKWLDGELETDPDKEKALMVYLIGDAHLDTRFYAQVSREKQDEEIGGFAERLIEMYAGKLMAQPDRWQELMQRFGLIAFMAFGSPMMAGSQFPAEVREGGGELMTSMALLMKVMEKKVEQGRDEELYVLNQMGDNLKRWVESDLIREAWQNDVGFYQDW